MEEQFQLIAFEFSIFHMQLQKFPEQVVICANMVDSCDNCTYLHRKIKYCGLIPFACQFENQSEDFCKPIVHRVPRSGHWILHKLLFLCTNVYAHLLFTKRKKICTLHFDYHYGMEMHYCFWGGGGGGEGGCLALWCKNSWECLDTTCNIL